MDDERVQIYRQITGFTPSIFQQDLIADRIKDVDRWRKAVIFWMGNAYRPQSVLKVIEYYEQMGKPEFDTQIGSRESFQFTSEPDPPCPYCGKEICWSDHRADMRIQ